METAAVKAFLGLFDIKSMMLNASNLKQGSSLHWGNYFRLNYVFLMLKNKLFIELISSRSAIALIVILFSLVVNYNLHKCEV